MLLNMCIPVVFNLFATAEPLGNIPVAGGTLQQALIYNRRRLKML